MSVSLENREQVEGIRKKYGHVLSSHVFNSIFIWRKNMGMTLYVEDDLFSAKCEYKGQNSWLFPCSDNEGKKRFIKKHLEENDFKLCYMCEADVAFLEENFPGIFCIERDKNSDEYLYSIEGHKELNGKNYANVRTQYNRIVREHELVTEKISNQNIQEALNFLENIGDNNSEDIQQYSSINDNGVDAELLLNRERLGIEGIIVFIDSKPVAVCAGYEITDDTFDVCMAKSISDIPGIGYYSKREMFLSVSDRYKFINLEEDLGIDGLRTMKKILSPIAKNKIWEATINEQK